MEKMIGGFKPPQQFRVWCRYHKAYEEHEMNLTKLGQLIHVRNDRFVMISSERDHVVEFLICVHDSREVFEGDVYDYAGKYLVLKYSPEMCAYVAYDLESVESDAFVFHAKEVIEKGTYMGTFNKGYDEFFKSHTPFTKPLDET